MSCIAQVNSEKSTRVPFQSFVRLARHLCPFHRQSIGYPPGPTSGNRPSSELLLGMIHLILRLTPPKIHKSSKSHDSDAAQTSRDAPLLNSLHEGETFTTVSCRFLEISAVLSLLEEISDFFLPGKRTQLIFWSSFPLSSELFRR